MRRSLLAALLALALLAAAAAIGWAVGSGERAAEPVVREALAQSSKLRGVKGRTLALTRVRIRPGATIPLHHHADTQVSYIDRGTLTYSVETASVKVMKGASDEHPKLVRRIGAGETGRIETGRWIVEQPNEKHHAANRGDVPVVIYLSTLFPTGAPPSIPDDPPDRGLAAAARPHGPAHPAPAARVLAAFRRAGLGAMAAERLGEVWTDRWAADPHVRGSYAAYLPGQYTRF